MDNDSRVRHIIRLVLLALLLGGGWVGARPVTADGTTHAGIVISVERGAQEEFCVDLGADGVASGEEVLRATGLDVIAEVGGMGGAVCKIEETGCNFPAQGCWCECTMMPGEPCTYWAYHHLQGGGWQQSHTGASTYQVVAGAVEGWSWGAGSVSEGTKPPVRTFEQVCAVELATATATHPPTPSQEGGNGTATATARPAATATDIPTALPQPTGTLIQATATHPPTPSGEGGNGTATRVPPTATRVPPTATRVPPTATRPPAPVEDGNDTATATRVVLPTVTEVPPTATHSGDDAGSQATATHPPTPSEEGGNGDLTPQASLPDGAGGNGGGGQGNGPIEGDPLPTLAAPVVHAPTPTVGGIAFQPDGQPHGEGGLPQGNTPTELGASEVGLYVVFALIVAGLVGGIGWMWLRQRGYGAE